MRHSNKSIVERSWGLLEYDVLTSKSQSNVEKARYGPSMVYDEFLRTGSSKLVARVLSWGMVMTMVLLYIKPVSISIYVLLDICSYRMYAYSCAGLRKRLGLRKVRVLLTRA